MARKYVVKKLLSLLKDISLQDTGLIGHRPNWIDVCTFKKRFEMKKFTTIDKQKNK